MKKVLWGVAALLASASPSLAADAIPYPNSGTYNNAVYDLTAPTSGDLKVYFAGASAGYDNVLGLVIGNGPVTGATTFGLDDHTSAIGDMIDFGNVNAGDTLDFVLKINGGPAAGGAYVYAIPSMNVAYDGGSPPGHNHIYMTDYTATGPVFGSIPAGTFIGFEDLSLSSSDFDYNDETFVYTITPSVGIEGSPGVPEPAVWGLLLAGFAGLGAALRRQAANLLAFRFA